MKNNRHGQATIFSNQDYEKIISCTVGENHRMIFRVAYYTGARMGEVVKLKTSDVYQESGKVLEVITYQAASTKTKETRQVPVNPKLKEFLQVYWQLQKPDHSGYLFPGMTKHLQFQSADDAFRRAIRCAGLDGLGFSTHSFRRTAATNLANAGIGIPVIQRFTGHRSLGNLQRYIDSSPVHVEKAVLCL
ncbi:site-specific integrase (plasmid) [Okeanomitos corallinicola TIOX110]|uniref:Site-specific integrase n=1 Tax=Okeanomitos corallinicola TIOX110 TaxID=3133117 RepID=A0ABZ2UZI0_9CYAN